MTAAKSSASIVHDTIQTLSTLSTLFSHDELEALDKRATSVVDESLRDAFEFIIAHNEHTRAEHLQHTLDRATLINCEARALLLGIVQRRYKGATGEFVTDVARLELLSREILCPVTLHTTCRYSSCGVESFEEGASYYAIAYKCNLRATGEVYVCPISGRAHRCDGLGCQFNVDTHAREGSVCLISGRLSIQFSSSNMHSDEADSAWRAGGSDVGGMSSADSFALIDSSATTAAAAAATAAATGNDDDNDDNDDEHKDRKRSSLAAGASAKHRLDSGPIVNGKRVRRADTAIAAAAAAQQQQQQQQQQRRRVDIRRYSPTHTSMCTLVKHLLFGNDVRDFITTRYVVVLKHFQRFVSRLNQKNSEHAGGAAYSGAWLCSRVTRIFADNVGNMQALLLRRVGAVPMLCQLTEHELIESIHRGWRERLPTSLVQGELCQYFTEAVFCCWSLLQQMPRDGTSSTDSESPDLRLRRVAVALLYMLHDGVCFSVLYDAHTRRLVRGFESLNSVNREHALVAARNKRYGHGESDAPVEATSEWARGLAPSVVRHYRDTLGDTSRLRCCELWLVPTHTYLANLPTSDMLTHMPIVSKGPLDSAWRTDLMNTRRRLMNIYSSIFDLRNVEYDTLTIDEVERRFCLHRHFAVQRNIGCSSSMSAPTELPVTPEATMQT